MCDRPVPSETESIMASPNEASCQIAHRTKANPSPISPRPAATKGKRGRRSPDTLALRCGSTHGISRIAAAKTMAGNQKMTAKMRPPCSLNTTMGRNRRDESMPSRAADRSNKADAGGLNPFRRTRVYPAMQVKRIPTASTGMLTAMRTYSILYLNAGRSKKTISVPTG